MTARIRKTASSSPGPHGRRRIRQKELSATTTAGCGLSMSRTAALRRPFQASRRTGNSSCVRDARTRAISPRQFSVISFVTIRIPACGGSTPSPSRRTMPTDGSEPRSISPCPKDITLPRSMFSSAFLAFRIPREGTRDVCSTILICRRLYSLGHGSD